MTKRIILKSFDELSPETLKAILPSGGGLLTPDYQSLSTQESRPSSSSMDIGRMRVDETPEGDHAPFAPFRGVGRLSPTR